eukprot:CCRYP_002876-RA/>CCRYP_002876-RA protein AED:0.53 eAED:0.40 QI:0/-1/0/1/-1/1/1/0/76
MLIGLGNVDDNDDAMWDIEEEQLSDIGDVTQTPKRDCLDLPLPPDSLPGTRQLKNYIHNTWFWLVLHRGGTLEDRA